MQMQVRHGLAGSFFTVDYQPIAIRNAQFRCKVPCHKVEMAQKSLVLHSDIVVRTNDLARDDQDVHGCLRVDVVKRDTMLVFVDYFGRYLLLDDFQENVVRQHGIPSIDLPLASLRLE
jgi:hypothetical protein